MAYKMLYTIYFISKNKDYNIPFDPLNNDELGNYSVIENYSFKTTMYILSGLLFIPFLSILANTSGLGKDASSTYIITLIIIFTICIFVSLVYPLIKGYNMSRESKNKLIGENRKEQYELMEHFILVEVDDDVKARIEMLDYRMKAIESVAIFPFKWRIWAKIVTLILLPILSYVFQIIISEIDLIELIRPIFLK